MTSLRASPAATTFFVGLCVLLYLFQLFYELDVQLMTMCPRLVLYLHEYYRIITSTLFHANLMHIGMNMMSTLAIGSMLEKRMGTLGLVFTILWAILLSGFLYLLIAWSAYVVFGFDQWMYTHSVGFSGIIFHMSVLECNLPTTSSAGQQSTATRNLFGVVNIPSALYPWALLIVLQFLVPGLSFLGHLSGILTGTLQYYGFLQPLMVSEHFLREMETSWGPIVWLANKLPNQYCVVPPTTTQLSDPSSLWQGICKGVNLILKFIRDVLETLWVCIFGRGRSLNSNIPLNPWRSSSGNNSGSPFDGAGRVLGTSLEDDDDWNGLPSSSDRDHVSRLV